MLTLVLHVNVYAYQRFSPKGVRACVRMHPDNNFECTLSRRSACQSFLALCQCIRNCCLCSCFMLHKKRKIDHQPFHPRSALQRLNFQGRGTTRNTALKIETW